MTHWDIIKEINMVGGIDIAHASQLARDKGTSTAIEVRDYVKRSYKVNDETANKVANFYLKQY